MDVRKIVGEHAIWILFELALRGGTSFSFLRGRRRTLRFLKITIVLFFLLVLGFSSINVWAQTEGDAERGGGLYVEKCAMCHGVDGKGRVGANLNDFPGIQVSETLVVTIRSGIAGGPMPAWGEESGGPFTDQDIADIAAYIKGAFVGTAPIHPLPEYIPPDIPSLPDIDGDPSAGAVVYQAECKACHGEGVGLVLSWLRVGSGLNLTHTSATSLAKGFEVRPCPPGCRPMGDR